MGYWLPLHLVSLVGPIAPTNHVVADERIRRLWYMPMGFQLDILLYVHWYIRTLVSASLALSYAQMTILTCFDAFSRVLTCFGCVCTVLSTYTSHTRQNTGKSDILEPIPAYVAPETVREMSVSNTTTSSISKTQAAKGSIIV